jgi:hypothetical protein
MPQAPLSTLRLPVLQSVVLLPALLLPALPGAVPTPIREDPPLLLLLLGLGLLLSDSIAGKGETTGLTRGSTTLCSLCGLLFMPLPAPLPLLLLLPAGAAAEEAAAISRLLLRLLLHLLLIFCSMHPPGRTSASVVFPSRLFLLLQQQLAPPLLPLLLLRRLIFFTAFWTAFEPSLILWLRKAANASGGSDQKPSSFPKSNMATQASLWWLWAR